MYLLLDSRDRTNIGDSTSNFTINLSNVDAEFWTNSFTSTKFGISKIPQNIYYVEKLPMIEGGKKSRKLAMSVAKEFNKTKFVYIYQ